MDGHRFDARDRRGALRLLVVALLLVFGAVVAAPAGAVEISPFPTPVSRAKFLAMGAVVHQHGFTSAQRAAIGSYLDFLCGDPAQAFTPLEFSYASFDKIYALEGVFDQAQTDCALSDDRLDLERGYRVSAMVRTKALLDRMQGVSNSQGSAFCTNLQASSRLTKPLLLGALQRAHIVNEGNEGLAKFGIALLYAKCSSLFG